ncbi:MAG: hypothetical protein GYB65_13150 [Chloroflexi bacterium]|nr:hypothetical protein [Chloroflexota bacterium]
MGFLDSISTAKENPLTVLLTDFQAQCTFRSMGLLQTYINDDQRAVFTLNDVTLHGLVPGNPAASMAMPELHVTKSGCHVLAFESQFSHEETGLMPRAEKLVLYTSHYAIQASFHMGTDANISDFAATSKVMFLGGTDAYIFPLFQPQAAIVQQAPLVFVHQQQVYMHHEA